MRLPFASKRENEIPAGTEDQASICFDEPAGRLPILTPTVEPEANVSPPPRAMSNGVVLSLRSRTVERCVASPRTTFGAHAVLTGAYVPRTVVVYLACAFADVLR